jgi:hypothetical protein
VIAEKRVPAVDHRLEVLGLHPAVSPWGRTGAQLGVCTTPDTPQQRRSPQQPRASNSFSAACPRLHPYHTTKITHRPRITGRENRPPTFRPASPLEPKVIIAYIQSQKHAKCFQVSYRKNLYTLYLSFSSG